MENDIKEINISIKDLFDLSSGIDDDEVPNAGSGLMVAKMVKDQPRIINNITYTVPVDISGGNGVAVVCMEFEKQDLSDYMRTVHACLEWLSTEDSENALFFSIVPLYLNGEVSIILQGLVHCEHYETKEGKSRVVLVFDNTMTQLTINEGVDIEKLQIQIERELANEEKSLEEELYALEEEKKEIEEEISGFKYEFNVDDLLEDEEEVEESEDKKPRIIFTSEEEENDDFTF